MSLPHGFIYVAGAVHLLVASANIFAFGKFRYLEHLRTVPLVVRQVFLVQNAYVTLVQVGFALLCFFFAGELTAGRSLGLALAGFLAVFWGSRVLLQLFYYMPALPTAMAGVAERSLPAIRSGRLAHSANKCTYRRAHRRL
jgi:hypothetical protein